MTRPVRPLPGRPPAFRRRWDAVGAALGVPTSVSLGVSPGSLQRGGATAFFQLTEDAVKLQLRARRRRLENLQIYVQEVTPAAFLTRLPEQTRLVLRRIADDLPRRLKLAMLLLDRGIPTQFWHRCVCRISDVANVPV